MCVFWIVTEPNWSDVTSDVCGFPIIGVNGWGIYVMALRMFINDLIFMYFDIFNVFKKHTVSYFMVLIVRFEVFNVPHTCI